MKSNQKSILDDTGSLGCQLGSHDMPTSHTHCFSHYPQLEAFWKSFGEQNIQEHTLFFGLRCLIRVHLCISAKAIQVALDGLQGIVTAFFSSLSINNHRTNTHTHLTSQPAMEECFCTWRLQTTSLYLSCPADSWWEAGLTLGLTLLSSLSFCFCSSNCRLFRSSSSILCCCSRRFLQQQKGCDIT